MKYGMYNKDKEIKLDKINSGVEIKMNLVKQLNMHYNKYQLKKMNQFIQ
jgi:hypothetical protein